MNNNEIGLLLIKMNHENNMRQIKQHWRLIHHITVMCYFLISMLFLANDQILIAMIWLGAAILMQIMHYTIN